MQKALIGALVALGVIGATLATQDPVHAQGIHLDVGNVAFGYRDGYWDHGHHWHHWRSYREARSYQHARGNQYNNWNHDRDHDQGWHQ